MVLLAAALWHLLRTATPLVKLRAQVRTLASRCRPASLYCLVITAVPFLLPLQFQLQFG